MRPERLLVVVLLVLSGCPAPVVDSDGGTGGGTGGGGSTTGGGAGGGGGASLDGGSQYARSAKGVLRFKGDIRLTADLAISLGIPFDQVCNELGQYACTYFVHPVALGGVDPYGKGLFEGASVTGVSTPVVTERVVLSACSKRVDLDLATPASALIFRGLPLDGGKLANPSGSQTRLAITELAQRAWLRDPSEGEIAHLIQLNTDIEATGVAEPGKTWMQAACFVAFTSAESVFY